MAVNSAKFSYDTLPHLSIGPRVVVAVAPQKDHSAQALMQAPSALTNARQSFGPLVESYPASKPHVIIMDLREIHSKQESLSIQGRIALPYSNQ